MSSQKTSATDRRRLLRYRAGSVALDLLRREGLHAGNLGAIMGPASGPKWLVLVGLDRALMTSGLLDGEARDPDHRPLLAGSSAGAWRMLTLASPDPGKTHRGLLDGYVGQVFSRRDTPATIGAAYRDMLRDLFSDEAISHLVDHPRLDLGIHVARVRGRLARRRVVQAVQLATAAAANLVSSRAMGWFFERMFLVADPGRLPSDFRGGIARLHRDNLLPAARATGAVPVYLDFIDSIPGLRPGVYVDGGVTDYHLDQRYLQDDRRLVLMPHYQRRIAPSWFDKKLQRRSPRPVVARNLLQVYPSEHFVEQLPGSRIPDRDEFTEYLDRPEERIRRWYEVAALSERLGEEFLDDLRSQRIADLAESID